MRSWNLSWCVPVDDAAIAVIAANCRRLELLSVFGLLGVTDASLDALAKGGLGKTLHTLDVHGCRNVTRQADQLLLKQFPRLTCFSHHS
jgi:F-box/leucine-rich repeat protein 2/20